MADSTTIPDATTTAAGTPTNVPVTSYMAGQVTNPTLPANSTLTPILQQVQNGENLTGNTAKIDTTSAAAGTLPQAAAPTINQQTATATSVNPNDVTAGLNPTGNSYNASLVSPNTPQATAAQVTVNPLDTVQGQLTSLYSQFGDGKTPPWAQAALQSANNIMAQRGMGASSIGAAAMVSAVQASAVQIASADASTYFNANLTNTNNKQQTALANLQTTQQSLLSDQSASNAAKQFNASSATQMQQFMASLVQSITSQNADRVTTISQFNAGQANTIATTNASNSLQGQEFNAQQLSTLEQFNSSLQNQREQFNAQNAFAVEQSNVTWRRSINTADTAAVNAANQVNVQNAYNMSSTALNNVWQQFRDESSWIFQAGQNQNTINANLAMASQNQNFIMQQQSNSQNAQFISQIADFAGKILLG